MRGDNADADKKCGVIETMRIGSHVRQVLNDSKDVGACAATSGFDLYTADNLPTEAKMAEICDIPACNSSISNLDGLNLPDCILKIPFVDAKLNFAKLLKQFQTACDSSSTSDSASGSTSDSTSNSEEDDDSDDKSDDSDDESDEDENEDGDK
uniref:Elicitin n=1 Tax=Peronospora matthiolae TaxID=2874970 RepID=A0AAV1VF48_9STRA